MQWCGSKNKSPTKTNAAEIKFDTMICLQMGKTSEAKLHRVNWVLLYVYDYFSSFFVFVLLK